MKLVMTRGLMIDIPATACALAKAASAAFLSPIETSNSTLPGLSGQTCGAPGLTALTRPTTEGSGVHLTSIASIASRAWSMVSATTKATASPTWRTSSLARMGYGGAGEGAGFPLEKDRQTPRVPAPPPGRNNHNPRPPPALV